jgi:hypothetical protein
MSAAALRVRRYRERQRRGVVCVNLEVLEVPLAERLVEAGMLHRDDADDRDRLRKALEQVVRLWAADGR